MTGITLHAFGEGPNRQLNQLREDILEIAKTTGIETREWDLTNDARRASLFEQFFESRLESFSDTGRRDIKPELVVEDDGATHYDLDGSMMLSIDGDPVAYSSWDQFYLEPVFAGLDPILPSLAYDALQRLGSRCLDMYRTRIGEESKLYDVVLTSHGTVDQERLSPDEQANFDAFVEDHTVVVITGWNLHDQGTEIHTTYDPDAIITEGGTILRTREDSGESLSYGRQALYGDQERHLAAKGTAAVLDQAVRILPQSPVFFSQGNEVSSCVYINPPRPLIHDELEEQMSDEMGIDNFRRHFERKCSGKFDIETDSTAKNRGRFENTPEAKYIFEKVQAAQRTFRPYQITEMNEEWIWFDLCSRDVYLTNEYEPLLDAEQGPPHFITSISLEAREQVNEATARRIVPQTDHCIDIFAQRKADCFDERLFEAVDIDIKSDNIIYLSKGTASDIDLITRIGERADKHGTTFRAHADRDAPRRLRRNDYVRTWDVDSPTRILSELQKDEMNWDLVASL
ncbi:hypothetical protein [Haloplanus halobius]|uniref:hypothetical protein n=1 Tax=Haloplanus halobius TaxID=2934938 RepID=UPI00200C87C7|nr:hypothetical protein [Haloplanus sp. XH21]